MQLSDPTQAGFWVPVGVSALCGGLIGLERQVRGKPVGIRTAILICLSTQIFVALGRAHQGEGADATRVLGQVVTGVGFLGGGVILARGGVVTGVTTAAIIWTLAAIGATIGFGELRAAVGLSVAAVTLVAGIELAETRLYSLRRGVHARNHEPPKPPS